METRICQNSRLHTENRRITPVSGAHNWGSWRATKNPTCEGKGIETRSCQNYSFHTENRDIPSLGHSYNFVGEWHKIGTYFECGETRYKCSRMMCNSYKSSKTNSHSYQYGSKTCTKCGYKSGY